MSDDAGTDYFSMFTNPLKLGDPENVLTAPGGIVITERLALNLFGDIEKALGQDLDWKVMQFEGKAQVTGICETPPSYSTDQFDFIRKTIDLQLNDQVKGRIIDKKQKNAYIADKKSGLSSQHLIYDLVKSSV